MSRCTTGGVEKEYGAFCVQLIGSFCTCIKRAQYSAKEIEVPNGPIAWWNTGALSIKRHPSSEYWPLVCPSLSLPLSHPLSLSLAWWNLQKSMGPFAYNAPCPCIAEKCSFAEIWGFFAEIKGSFADRADLGYNAPRPYISRSDPLQKYRAVLQNYLALLQTYRAHWKQHFQPSFSTNIILFCGNMGPFCGNIGHFCWHIGLLGCYAPSPYFPKIQGSFAEGIFAEIWGSVNTTPPACVWRQ